ncbi:MAG: class I SAM-dependent methyltransferase [Candidatus Daviesbacteria bacterium]
MEWMKYYSEEAPVILGEHAFIYQRAIDGLRLMNQDVLDPSKQLNFVLGGFHNTWTVADFISLGNKIHRGEHQNILLDMHKEPLDLIDKRYGLNLLQARLEELPFSKESVDLLVMDFTLNFMEDDQVKKFAHHSQGFLDPEGLILTSFMAYPNQNWWDKLNLWYHDVPSKYSRTPETLASLLTPLKSVFFAKFETSFSKTEIPIKPEVYFLILARKDSLLPAKIGKPFLISRPSL